MGVFDKIQQGIDDLQEQGSFSTANGGSKGLAGGDRIQATLVFERI